MQSDKLQELEVNLKTAIEEMQNVPEPPKIESLDAPSSPTPSDNKGNKKQNNMQVKMAINQIENIKSITIPGIVKKLE